MSTPPFPGLPELSRKEGCPCGRLFVTEWGPKGKGVTLDFKGAFGILKIPTIRGVAVACCQSQAGRKSGFFLATNVSFIRMRLCIGRVTSGCPRGPGCSYSRGASPCLFVCGVQPHLYEVHHVQPSPFPVVSSLEPVASIRPLHGFHP